MAISKIGSDALAAGAPSRSQLPAGTVLQVVNATYATETSTTSATFVTTNLTASITPTSATSKILVLTTGSGVAAANGGTIFTIYRNSTNLSAQGFCIIGNPSSTTGTTGTFAINYLDSPATTSATSYTLYFESQAGTSKVHWNNQPSSITLMEIAA